MNSGIPKPKKYPFTILFRHGGGGAGGPPKFFGGCKTFHNIHIE